MAQSDEAAQDGLTGYYEPLEQPSNRLQHSLRYHG